MAVKARTASRALQALRSEDRVAILNRIAESLEQHEQHIMAENALDVEAAGGGKVSDALLQRLILKPSKIQQLAGGFCATLCNMRSAGSERMGISVQVQCDGGIWLMHSCEACACATCTPCADGIRAIAKQEEPIGRLLSRLEVAEGLVLDKVRSHWGQAGFL